MNQKPSIKSDSNAIFCCISRFNSIKNNAWKLQYIMPPQILQQHFAINDTPYYNMIPNCFCQFLIPPCHLFLYLYKSLLPTHLRKINNITTIYKFLWYILSFTNPWVYFIPVMFINGIIQSISIIFRIIFIATIIIWIIPNLSLITLHFLRCVLTTFLGYIFIWKLCFGWSITCIRNLYLGLVLRRKTKKQQSQGWNFVDTLYCRVIQCHSFHTPNL